MKPIKAQERTRRQYHDDSAADTVHRASLLAPKLPGSEVEITFANHFLLKRGYSDVACRMTAIGEEGERLASRTHRITEPRVYVFELADLCDESVGNYSIEFFSAENFFYPFPAVVMNHRNAHSLNSVHSYNRVLNDIFEDDEINASNVAEASIDVRVDRATDTFAVVTSGPSPSNAPIGVSLDWADRQLQAQVQPRRGRLSNTMLSMRELFGAEAERPGGVLRVRQPPQAMFYGRMLAGLSSLADGAVAANHSFYDCSNVAEYWPDGQPSSRVYPLLDGFKATLRLYPIFSPCRLNARIALRDARGHVVGSFDCPPLLSPSADVLDVCIDEVANQIGPRAADATSFSFAVWPESGGTPRRINHQLIYSDPEGRSPLSASVAISLKNPNTFRPPNARGLCWGQCAIGTDLNSRLGLVLDEPDGAEVPVELAFFSEDGEVYRKALKVTAGAACVVNPAALLPELVDRPVRYLWYWATSERADLAAYAVTRNRQSGHCSGEHSF